MKSITSIKQSEITEKWYLVNAEGKRLGRVASAVAQLLQGKLNPKVRSYHDPKVKVVVVNADKLDITTKRGETEFFRSYSGYPDGLKFTSLAVMMEKNPVKALEITVKGMLPKTKKGNAIFSNLRVYKGGEHKHEAQVPEELNIDTLKF